MNVLKTLAIVAFGFTLEAIADQDPLTPPAGKVPERDSVSEFQRLKYDALQLEAKADLERAPASGNVEFYVGNVAGAVRLKHIALSVDGQAVAIEPVDDAAFHALDADDRLIRVGRVPAEGGRHAVHAEFQIVSGLPRNPAEQTVIFDESISWEPKLVAVSLRLKPSRLLTPIHIGLQRYRTADQSKGWRAKTLHAVGQWWGVGGGLDPGETGDPAVAYAEYLHKSGHTEGAAVELMKISSGDVEALPADYWLRTASIFREAGLWDYSRTICDRLDTTPGLAAALATEWLQISIRDYDAGRISLAEEELRAIRSGLPADRVQDWQLAEAGIQFLHGQNREAETVLQDRDKDDTEAFRYSSQADPAIVTTAFRHYNLAVAMVRNGEEAKGLSLLDLIGRIKSQDKDLLAIRDQANLSLGWYFLRKEKGITAMGALGRVRSEGRASEMALLGMGWAQLAPAGERIPRVRLDRDDLDSLTPLPAPVKHSLTSLGVFNPELNDSGGPSAFERGDPPKDANEGLRRALLFWQELAKRDINNPVVQEGLLAIAYAHDRLGDVLGAREAYAAAIASLEARKKDVAEEMDFISTNGLPALADQGSNTKEGSEVLGKGFLAPNAPNREVFSAIDRYHDLGTLSGALRDLQSSGLGPPLSFDLASKIRSLEDDIEDARKDELKDVQAQAIQDLNRQQMLFIGYLQAAYLSAARLSDRRVAMDDH